VSPPSDTLIGLAVSAQFNCTPNAKTTLRVTRVGKGRIRALLANHARSDKWIFLWHIDFRVVRGSILCDLIQPNSSADWPNPTQHTTSGESWTQPEPTQYNYNKGAYSLVVAYFYTQNLSGTFSQPSINLFMFYVDHYRYLVSPLLLLQWTRPDPTHGSTQPMDNSDRLRLRAESLISRPGNETTCRKL